jgi:hypothetical protein
VLWSGRTDAQGLAPIAALPARTDLASCSKDYRFYEGLGQLDGGLFITAQSGDDLAFVHSSWDQGIESWRFRLPTTESAEPAIAHTILDRALFRAGETVSMKHVIRRPVPRGLGPSPRGSGPAASSSGISAATRSTSSRSPGTRAVSPRVRGPSRRAPSSAPTR